MQKVTCNICGERYEFDEVFHDPVANFRAIRCRGDGLIFLNPMLTPREHLNYYNTKFWNDIPVDRSGSYVDFPPERVERWTTRAKGHIDYFSNFCTDLKNGSRMHALDVGCGYAAHLEELFRRCPQATLTAVEPNRRLHNSIHKRMPHVTLIGKTLMAMAGMRTQYDCIIMTQVLDHCVDPTTACRRIYTLLARNGLALITVHNTSGSHGHVYDCDHLYYFTRHTLHRLLEKCHLDAVRIETRHEMGHSRGDDLIYAVIKKK